MLFKSTVTILLVFTFSTVYMEKNCALNFSLDEKFTKKLSELSILMGGRGTVNNWIILKFEIKLASIYIHWKQIMANIAEYQYFNRNSLVEI